MEWKYHQDGIGIPSRWNNNSILMEWECHLDGINQIGEGIDLSAARPLNRLGGAVEKSRHRGNYDTV